MKLLMDVGNSRIKWALMHGENLSEHAATLYTHESVSEQLNQISTVITKPEQVWVANVAGNEIDRQIAIWCDTQWQCAPAFARVERDCAGVTNAYRDISRLGVDRWLALIGARTHTKKAVLIADCGSAFTLDAMDTDGRHFGGLIIPGILLMRNALYKTTPAIPVSNLRPGSGLADNTDEAVANGCALAIASTIERIRHDLQSKGFNDMKCILSGGDAEQIAMLMNIEFEIRPHLVLEGLAVYAGQHG